MTEKIQDSEMPDIRQILLDALYKTLDDLKRSGAKDSKRFLELLDLADFAGNPANMINIKRTDCNDQFSLVKGTFNPEDANNILSVLYNSKIDFHVRSAVSHELRNGEPAPLHAKRIDELEEAYSRVKEIISIARGCGMKMNINATLDIELIP